MNKQKIVKTLGTIADDMKKDAAEMDGQPFTGKTVAKFYGYHGAAIAALAKIVEELVEETVNEPDES